ncbi:expressed unknown protein [Seminavis robusta]|uniref:Uncharacterized protein n=1 Tax=Seminavis robusta TaxID=568900 RepID=A0A9N8HVC7_9STRA|nr:expressed unknown protein [Seminavis robusta]|eukprot:Sro2299_g322470.1 n/a (143) ;mRNA; r:8337-8765
MGPSMLLAAGYPVGDQKVKRGLRKGKRPSQLGLSCTPGIYGLRRAGPKEKQPNQRLLGTNITIYHFRKEGSRLFPGTSMVFQTGGRNRSLLRMPPAKKPQNPLSSLVRTAVDQNIVFKANVMKLNQTILCLMWSLPTIETMT